ncbi:hypothetical protein BCR32DRAFT_301089 [Anaeromyces robustus]|uniref:SF3 helicase domain-containing protein n=1 Tax=Anaeromyces robustus TaxID=1754192 RepID=A0A1Y1X0J9_9FUNG|nr:hypothetical protein BCR32DRAFT_301089 [Anaeromyces robustus]|eukprot:ORX79232.1 hypothetical protein BCR32DRAFT_301089 [Anaeromyces robustus]
MTMLYEKDFKFRLDKKPIIRFKNLVYDVDKDKVRNGIPLDFCSKSTNYDFYIPKQEELNEVNNFISRLMPKKNIREFLLKILGSLLFPGNIDRIMLFFIGIGRNGKSALVNLLSFAMGEYASKPNVSLFLGKSIDSSKADPNLIHIDSTRVAICEEPDNRNVSITGVCKAITGNVGFITGRDLYKSLTKVYANLVPIICSNNKLTIINLDKALVDRIIVIPFPKYMLDVNSKNEQVEEIIWQGNNSEKYAMTFMYILMDALRKYKKESLIIPNEVKKATKEFILKGDSVGRFIKDKLVESEGIEINIDIVWNKYKQWYKLNNKSRNRLSMTV